MKIAQAFLFLLETFLVVSVALVLSVLLEGFI